MKVSQFNRAKEIMATLGDLERMKSNLSKDISSGFTRLEKDPESYSYNEKKIEVKIYPNANEFALVFQAELLSIIEDRIETQKKKLNNELDEL